MKLKDYYEHEHTPSIFIMFDKNGVCQWCYSGNELKRIYEEAPEQYISTPIEVPIPEELDKELTYLMDNY